MKSLIFALIVLGLFLTVVQCKDKTSVAEYEIKQGLLSGGRTYEITGKTNAASKFSTRYEPFNLGKKLFLLQDGKERFIVKHDILNLMSTWTITDPISNQELGRIRNRFKLFGSKIETEGDFGHYIIEGDFGTRSYTISKDEHKVAHIEKKGLHLHDTYGLTVYGDADQALMVLFAVIVDEIREH